MEPARVPRSISTRPTSGPGARPAVAVRLARVEPRPNRTHLRHALPDRAVHTGAEAGARLLRPAVPARRRAGRTRRTEGRSQAFDATDAGRPPRAGAPR